MAEEELIQHAQAALAERGITDELVAVGQFYPRGHTGGGFIGGMVGGDLGGLAGNLGEGVGVAGGFIAGTHAHDAASGLPDDMLVGVSATAVYGFAVKHRNAPRFAILFQVPRDGLDVKVHQRVNVRVLELIDAGSGSRIELEGNRLPITHSRDVIDELRG